MSVLLALAAAHRSEPPNATEISTQPGFNLIHDNRNNELFFYYSPGDHTANYSEAVDVASFNKEEMEVQNRVTSIFDTDLTPRDDILVAILSLFLLLIIEGIVTTILLRSAHGAISNFGFSVKHFVEDVQNFRFRDAVLGKGKGKGRNFRLNYCLLSVAMVFLVSTFVLELGVLLLTDQGVRNVSNSNVAFHLLQPISPEWKFVRFQARISINRPCIAVTLSPVDAQQTSISTCMVSDITDEEFLFEAPKAKAKAKDKDKEKEKEKDKIDVVPYHFVTRLHKYGADHEVTIGNMTASFSARAYLQLQDGKERLMSVPPNQEPYKAGQVHLIHKMYIGFLMSSHIKATKDKRITEDLMRSIEFSTSKSEPGQGGEIDIINKRQGNGVLKVPSTRFETTGEAPDIGSKVALAYGLALFKGCIGLQVGEGKTKDLITSKGEEEDVESYMWAESSRMLNWLSLLILLVLAFTTLLVLRWFLKPIATTEIAATYVSRAVNEDFSHPLQQRTGKKRFYVRNATVEEREPSYSVGAETDELWDRQMEEYDFAAY